MFNDWIDSIVQPHISSIHFYVIPEIQDGVDVAVMSKWVHFIRVGLVNQS